MHMLFTVNLLKYSVIAVSKNSVKAVSKNSVIAVSKNSVKYRLANTI